MKDLSTYIIALILFIGGFSPVIASLLYQWKERKREKECKKPPS